MQIDEEKKGFALGFQEVQSWAPPNLAGRRECEKKATFLEMMWSSQVLSLVTKNKHMAALRKHWGGRDISNGLNQHLKLHWKQMTVKADRRALA